MIARTVACIRDFYQKLADSFPDLVLNEEKDKKKFVQTMDYEIPHHYALGQSVGDLVFSMAALLRTPRLMNLVFRKVEWVWGDLHGEVLLGDLLVATTLRYCAPTAYDYLLENAMTLKATSDQASNRKEARERWQADWASMAARHEWNQTAALSLVKFLFPEWERQTPAGQQGVASLGPTDYWRRLNRGALSDSEIRDQEVLKTMAVLRGLSEEATQSVVPRLHSSHEFSAKFEQFAADLGFDGWEIRKLAAMLFRYAAEQDGVGASDESCAGFTPLWRLALRDPIDDEEHRHWVQGEVIGAMGSSFRLANAIYYFWSSNRSSEIREETDRTALWGPIVEALRSALAANPLLLAKKFDHTYLYSGYHFAVHYSTRGGGGFDPSDWRWFAKSLVDAAEADPLAIKAQVVGLLVTEPSPRNGFQCSVMRETEGMFTGLEDSLSSLAGISSSVDALPAGHRRMVEFFDQKFLR